MLRTIRIFFKALWLTLTGRAIQPAAVKYPRLTAWVAVGVQRVDTVLRIADKHSWEQAKRERLLLHLDKRDISMQTILTAVRHNLTREYPMLLESNLEHAITTLKALNLNDLYRVAALRDAPDLAQTPIRDALAALHAHLDALPDMP